ncbi:MAG TPA: aldose 1-epimerase family protein [Anaerolineales bacterium]|nr:aldose 1-epimerase family protein [Anaerolineales bacterium]
MPDLDYLKWDRGELLRHVGHMEQIAGIKPVEGADGLERGTRIFEVWTGSGLYYHVLADRGLDISTCHYKGISLAWRSPVGDAHPAYYDAAGAAWLRSFQGGMLVTCGLDTFGPASQDEGEDLGQHGRASSLPASHINYLTYWQDGSYWLEITGEVRQAKVYGENLVLRRRITSALGANKIRIEDTVTNEDFKNHPHMILYDINIGFPMLSERARLQFEVDKTVPFDDYSLGGIEDWRVFQSPEAGFREFDFIHTPKADQRGWASLELENPALKLGLRIAFNTATLPYLAQWKMMGEGLYVLAMQPMNTNVWGGRAEVRRQNALPYLEAGESRGYEVEIDVVEYP